jgi:Spy/CpxP family protein refolding chaperone
MNDQIKKLLPVLLASMAFVMLTGFYGRCGSDNAEGRAKKITRIAHAHVDDFLDDVDATGEQRGKIATLTDRVLGEGLPLIGEHQQAKKVLLDQWRSEKPDAAKVHSVIDERVDGIRRVLHTVADAAIELHQLLTPEQRKEINEDLPSE